MKLLQALLFEERYIMKTFYWKMMISQYLLSVYFGQCIQLGVCFIMVNNMNKMEV